MRKEGFFGTYQTERNLTSFDLANKRRPHLKDRIRKSELENSARYGGMHGFETYAEAAPRLLLIPRIGIVERIGVGRIEAGRSFNSVYFKYPFIR